VRLITAAACAVAFVAIGLRGSAALLTAVSMILMSGIAFYKLWLQVKEETFPPGLTTEGFVPGFAAFLLIWSALWTLTTGPSGAKLQ
jgi:hypothetical protein